METETVEIVSKKKELRKYLIGVLDQEYIILAEDSNEARGLGIHKYREEFGSFYGLSFLRLTSSCRLEKDPRVKYDYSGFHSKPFKGKEAINEEKRSDTPKEETSSAL